LLRGFASGRIRTLIFDYMQKQTEALGQAERRTFFSFTKTDARWLVILYVSLFLAFRFDVLGHHVWFRDPMHTVRAAWIALPWALVGTIVAKIRFWND
jgi:hypothetical protein